MNKKLAELIAKRNALKTQARSLVEATDVPAEELEEKSNTIVAALAEIERNIEALKNLLELAEEVEETVEEIPELPEAVVPSADEDEARSKRGAKRTGKRSSEVRSAFYRALAEPKEARSLTTSDAGMLIPTDVEEPIIQAVASTVFIRDLATVRTIRTNTKVPAFTAAANFAVVPEGTSYPEVDLEVGGAYLEPKKIGGICKVTEETLWLAAKGDEGAQADIEEALAEGLSNAEENYFLNGDGEDEPQGVFTAAPVRVNAGAALKAQDFIDLFYSIPERYRKNGTWVMNSTTAAMLRGLEDTAGNPIWESAGLKSDVDTLLGRPVRTSEFAPEMGAGKVAVVFGDFTFYRIGDRVEKYIKTLGEKYIDTGHVGIRVTLFGDAAIAVPKAFGAIKQGS